MWSFANGQQSILKAISNDCFSLLLLNGKSKGDGHLTGRSKEAKIEAPFFKDAFLIIWFYWPNLCFFGIRVGIYKDNYIRKNGDDIDTGIADADGADKAGTNIAK